MDIWSHKLVMDVGLFYKTGKRSYKVEIQEICSYLFYDQHLYKKEYDFEKRDTAEVTSFYYMPAEQDTFNIKSKKVNPPRDIEVAYNIYMEIWESELYIKANKLLINDEVFELE